jgi:hypothetical protein
MVVLIGKPEGKRPLGRPRHGRKDNIKINFRERGWDDVDWIHMAQDKEQWCDPENTVMNHRVA